MKKYYSIVILVLLFTVSGLKAQILRGGKVPYVRNFTPEEYKAADQTWDAVQDDRGIMYFANSSGILEFDGKTWNLIKLPAGGGRALSKAHNGIIYVGARYQMGLLDVDSTGSIYYKSLKNKIPKEFANFGYANEVIATDNDGVCFVTSSGALYVYKNDTFKIYKDTVKFKKSFYIYGKYYIESENTGLKMLSNGNLVPILGSEEVSKNTTKAMLPYNGKILVVTHKNGIYLYDGSSFTKIKTPIDNIIKKRIYTAKELSNGLYAFLLEESNKKNVISGLIITDTTLTPIRVLNTTAGLATNRLYNVFSDRFFNLWISTYYGISYVNITTPFIIYNNDNGLSGASKASILYKNSLYVASNGLYRIKWNDSIDVTKKEIFESNDTIEKKQVWNLDTINGNLYASFNGGLAKISGKSAYYLRKDKNVYRLMKLYGKNYAIAGESNDLVLYKIIGNSLIKKWSVKGYKINEGRHFSLDKYNNLWLQSRKLTKIVLNESLDSVIIKKEYGKESGLPEDRGNVVYQSGDTILIGTRNGVYAYDYNKDMFYPVRKINVFLSSDKNISSIYTSKDGYIFIKLTKIREKDNVKYWDLILLKPTKNGEYRLISSPFIRFRSNIHHINELSDNKFIIGTKNGIVLYYPNYKLPEKPEFDVFIRKVETIMNDSLIFGGIYVDKDGNRTAEQNKQNIIELPYKLNSLRFTFGVNFFEYTKELKFKYYLEGNDKNWSDWKPANSKEYSNLAPGTYTLHVKCMNYFEQESNVARYTFVILPPWYLTWWAIVIYAILAVLIVIAIVKIYTRSLVKEKERLERIVAERTAEIRQQKDEIEAQKDEIEAQKEELEKQRDKLAEQNEIIQEKNKSITDSINYAKRIQEAMLPLEENIKKYLPEYFILFKPRDIVSGDFYWFAEKNGKIIITAVDCTGHGVPGAFMSMIGSEILTTLVSKGITDASQLLTMQNRYVRTALKQDTTDNQDGMDMALCVIDKQAKTVEFAGAKNPLIYIHDNQLFHIKGDKQSIGGYQNSENYVFKKHIINYETPTYFYIFSDGFPDQFGGPDSRKFMIKRLKNLLLDIHKKPMTEQKEILNQTIENWMKNTEQTDDILLIGFSV